MEVEVLRGSSRRHVSSISSSHTHITSTYNIHRRVPRSRPSNLRPSRAHIRQQSIQPLCVLLLLPDFLDLMLARVPNSKTLTEDLLAKPLLGYLIVAGLGGTTSDGEAEVDGGVGRVGKSSGIPVGERAEKGGEEEEKGGVCVCVGGLQRWTSVRGSRTHRGWACHS